MQTKKLNNFRDEEHGAKAKPLGKKGEEIKARGLLEEQESYYLQSAHLFKLDGADLEKPEAPFRASKSIMEKLQSDRAVANWYNDRPGFGGDPGNTLVPEWYQELMGLLGPWMDSGGAMLFFNIDGYQEGMGGNFHAELWRVRRETRQFILTQLFDPEMDGFTTGMDPAVRDWIYNWFIEKGTTPEGESLNAWMTPDMITPQLLSNMLNHVESARFYGPNGEEPVWGSGAPMNTDNWWLSWMESGGGVQYALDNEWDWPPSIDPFGVWQAAADSNEPPSNYLIHIMQAGIQLIPSMVQFFSENSDPSQFPDLDVDVDYEAAGYDSAYEYFYATSELFAQNPIAEYYEVYPDYPHYAMAAVYYPQYLQQFFDLMGVNIDVGIANNYAGYDEGTWDSFFEGEGFEEYQGLLDLFGDYDHTHQHGLASYFQAYLTSNGPFGYQAQLGALMDWYATGVFAGHIELSEAAMNTFELAYEAYENSGDTFNWFWFDFSQDIGSDEFLNIFEYNLASNGVSPDWGQDFSDPENSAGENYNTGNGNSYYNYDPAYDISYSAEAWAGAMPGIAGDGIPEWYTVTSNLAFEWNQNHSTNFNNAYNYAWYLTAHALSTIFNYDGDNNITGTEMQDLADMGYPVGQIIIDHFNNMLPAGETTGMTLADITPELLTMEWQSSNGLWMYNLIEQFPMLEPYVTSVGHGPNGLTGWLFSGGNNEQWDEAGTGNSLFGSHWHGDFFNNSAFGQANGGNGMPSSLDPLGIWAYNTFGGGAGSGFEMGGNTTGVNGYSAGNGGIALFQIWGNQGMNDDQDGNLWDGQTNLLLDSEGWAADGIQGGYQFLNAINYLTGYLQQNGAGAGYTGDSTYPSIWVPLYEYLSSLGYDYAWVGNTPVFDENGDPVLNENGTQLMAWQPENHVYSDYYQNNPELLELYQVENPEGWQILDSAFMVLVNYFSLNPVNPIMPDANFMADQIAMMDWYVAGVVGAGDPNNQDSWNGPILEDLSDAAIETFQAALETGSFWFNFNYEPGDDNFMWTTNTNLEQFFGDGFIYNSGQAGSWDEVFTYIDIDPGAGMENLLGENPILNLSNWVSSHGGMIDYNGDGRVDMGDFLEFVSWANFGTSEGAEMYGLIDLSQFIEFGLTNNSAALGIGEAFNMNNLGDANDISGGTNWLFSPLNMDLLPGGATWISGSDVAGLDSYGGNAANISAGGAEAGVFSYGSLMASFLIFQFVNDYVDSGGSVPEWYNFILGQEADDSGFGGQVEFGDSEGFDVTSGGLNALLNAVYPQWSEWSESTGFDFSEQNVGTTVIAIVGMIEALLPPVEVMTNYASYYLTYGIDINQQLVNADGSTVSVVAGGNSLSEGLDSELFSVSQQNYVVGLVSNNAPAFAALDVNQDGEYGTTDYLAVSLVTALLTEWFNAQGMGASSELNLNDIIVQLYNNHASWSVIFAPHLLADIDANGTFGGSTNVREALNYLLNVVQFGGFISTDPDAPNQPSAYDVQAALVDLFTSVATSMLQLSGQSVEVVNPGVLTGDWSSLSDDEMITLLGQTYTVLIFNNAATTPSGLPEGGLAVLQTLFEGTDGTYFLDADGNQVPFSFTEAGLQALMGATSGSQAGSTHPYYNDPVFTETFQEMVLDLEEAGLSIDFNGDGVYDMNDINILLNIVENGPMNATQVQIAEILNYVDGVDSVDFGIDDVILFMNYFGNPGETTVYGDAGSAYSWIDSDGDQTVYSGTSINMFGYFDDNGAWVDFDYDDLTPDDYFGPGWAATQTNNNETTS